MHNSYSARGGSILNTDASGKRQPVDLTITVDEQTNTVIVACTEQIFREIEKLVERLDKAAQNQTAVLTGSPGGIDWSETNGAQVGQAPRSSRNHSAAEAAR
jgi:hypothetical protein